MNLRKLLILMSMSLAAVAFAVPASASADIFTHEGEPASGQSANFSGSAGFNLAADATRGIHCTTVDFTLVVSVWPPGIFASATFDTCTTTSPVAQENGLPTDATAVNLASWVAEPDVANSRIIITNVHINNKVTHPVTTHLVLAESTLKGTMIANIPGSTSNITTATLSDSGATVQFGVPPAGSEIEANVSGHLTSNGTIGIE